MRSLIRVRQSRTTFTINTTISLVNHIYYKYHHFPSKPLVKPSNTIHSLAYSSIIPNSIQYKLHYLFLFLFLLLLLNKVMGSSPNSKPKIIRGSAGYVLEDVPHLSDYIPELPVRTIHFPILLLLSFYSTQKQN